MRARYCVLPLLLVVFLSSTLAKPQGEAPSFTKAAVVSVDPIASNVGLEMLKKGGNAVDAAVATGLALAVTWPAAGNLGGGGFMLIYLTGKGEVTAIDYREKAPEKAAPKMFLNDRGEVDSNKSGVGYLGLRRSLHFPIAVPNARRLLPFPDSTQRFDASLELCVDGSQLDSLASSQFGERDVLAQESAEEASIWLIQRINCGVEVLDFLLVRGMELRTRAFGHDEQQFAFASLDYLPMFQSISIPVHRRNKEILPQNPQFHLLKRHWLI